MTGSRLVAWCWAVVFGRRHLRRLLRALRRGDTEAASVQFWALASRAGAQGAFVACWVLARAIARSQGLMARHRGSAVGMQLRDGTGRVIADPDHDPAVDRPTLAVVRFVTAYANGDTETATAVFYAVHTDCAQDALDFFAAFLGMTKSALARPS